MKPALSSACALVLMLATSASAQLASPSYSANCTAVGPAEGGATSPATRATIHAGGLASGELLSASFSVRLTATCGDVRCSVLLCGDCDGNSILNVLDALLGAQHAVAIVTLTGVAFESCNVDDDFDVDVLDSLFIAQTAAGVSVPLSCC